MYYCILCLGVDVVYEIFCLPRFDFLVWQFNILGYF